AVARFDESGGGRRARLRVPTVAAARSDPRPAAEVPGRDSERRTPRGFPDHGTAERSGSMNGTTGAIQTIHSPWLGDLEWDPECEILFPCGLPGFEDEHRILPVEIPAQRPLVYLQSIENTAI